MFSLTSTSRPDDKAPLSSISCKNHLGNYRDEAKRLYYHISHGCYLVILEKCLSIDSVDCISNAYIVFTKM